MKGSVLIAEDESLIAEELRERLERMGFSIAAVVASGDAAVEAADRTLPDLVLMDIRLKGGMDGIDAAGRITERHEVPVVYLTAHSDDATMDRAKRTLPHGYLLKPIAEGDLRATIEMALHKFRSEHRRRKADQQLQQTLKLSAVGRLAGGVAHFINNDMTVLMGYTEVLLNRLQPEDPHRPMIASIRTAAERSALVARRLVSFSRQQILRPTFVMLNGLLRKLDPTLRRVATDAIAIEYDVEPNLGLVSVDTAQMQQTILHLALNARDSMPEGGTLRFETRNVRIGEGREGDRLRQGSGESHMGLSPGEWVMLAMSDTGGGMDEHTRLHLFEPFFTTKDVGQGLGLTLAAVYGFIKQSDGDIFVSSEVGRGTSFRIYLPRIRDQVARPGGADLPKGTETILVVEDDYALRGLIRQILQACGYTVLIASSGAEALRLADRERETTIDLVITDASFSQLGGAELVRRLTVLRPAISVIYVAGSPDASLRVMLGSEAALLRKPFSPLALSTKVRETLDARLH